jgi:hypothetical protein
MKKEKNDVAKILFESVDEDYMLKMVAGETFTIRTGKNSSKTIVAGTEGGEISKATDISEGDNIWVEENSLVRGKSKLAGDVFIPNNVRRISRLRWCCLLVSLICLPATFFYLPLLFMVVIMGFLGLVVSVVANVMAAAVEIREENDMTI